ncbi:MAG: electron transport complex subunit RsxG, partial [Sulfuricellaceae bacterium]|nr:electron transport complex subunit RsxG [Sulfuricellaceae bacterium]
LIDQTLPPGSYDNQLLRDSLTLPPTPELGTDQPSTAYRARWQGKPSAVVLEAIAPDGYGGKINMIIAIRYDGEVSGVRVVAHNETPGLGDYIEIAKSQWIHIFDGASLINTRDKDWNVKKDGGKFDYMTGATITPRAMVQAVHHAVLYFNAKRQQLFASTPLTGDKP